jgi:MFS superfamily sulfate permease-like transporter
LLAKMNIKRVLCFDILVDIGASIALIIMFAGTFAGMMAGILGGAIISIVLFILKRTIGYEKPKREGFKVRWVNVPPR